MRKVLILLLTFTMVNLMGGCFSPKIETESGTISLKDGEIEVQDKEGNTSIISTEGDNVEISSEDGTFSLGEGMSLPEDYPGDLVPVYEGANITLASKSEKAGKAQFWTAYEIMEEPGPVFKFYKEILEDAQNIEKMETSELYTITCEKEDMEISISVSLLSQEEGKISSIVNIHLVQIEGDSASVAIGDKEKAVEVPEGYPEDVIPLLEGKVTVGQKNVSNDRASFHIIVESEKETKDINKFYQNAFSNAQDVEQAQSASSYSIKGNLEDNYVEIYIDPIEDSEEFKSEIEIWIQPNE